MIKAPPGPPGHRCAMLEAVSFSSREEAGKRLARLLDSRSLADPVVYALPRGGVPVACEIARELKAPMDLILVRKIGAPGEPELALGAVAEGRAAEMVINEDVRRMIGVAQAEIDSLRQAALKEIERRRTTYLSGRARIDPKGRTAIVVDDGLATGATAKAAIRALKADGAARVILAVPVAPPETAAQLREEADEVICLATPSNFMGVGMFYVDFHQLSDAETIALLDQARGPEQTRGPDQAKT
jgi:putative phosphoribosyl transferase